MFLSKKRQTSVAARSSFSSDFKRGLLWSSAIPVYDTKVVGIHKVIPYKNAGEDGSHAEYPLASKVFLTPLFERFGNSGIC